jgi:hypothetical protein
LNLKENLDDVLSDGEERVVTYGRANDSDGFDNLATELLVFGLVEFTKDLDQHLEGLLEVGHESLFGDLNNRCECGGRVFLANRDAVLDKQKKLLSQHLLMGEQNFSVSAFCEVSEGSTSVGSHTGN